MTKRTVIIVALLAVVLGLMISGAIAKATSDPEPVPPETQDSQAATEPNLPTLAATGDPNLALQVPAEEDGEIKATVQSFILAYAGQRWDDPAANSWLDRATRFTTETYASQLRSLYGQAGSDRGWSVIVESRTVRQANIDKLEIVQSKDLSKGSVTVIAGYRISSATEGSAPDSFEPFTKMVTLQKSGAGWQVASFGEVASGSVPQLSTPTQTPVKPPKIDDHGEDHQDHED